MIARIASLLGFGGVSGSSTQLGSAYGPSACPLCCRPSVAAQATELPPRRLSVRRETATSLLRGYTLGSAGNARSDLR